MKAHYESGRWIELSQGDVYRQTLEVAAFLHAPNYRFVDNMVPSISQLSTAVIWYKEIFLHKIFLHLRGKQTKVPLVTEDKE